MNSGPLTGVRVLDFTRVLSGPYCTMMLADFGAEVIKIERPDSGDEARGFYPVKDGESGYFLLYNRNKKSICLNLKDEEDRKTVLKLVEDVDVLVENFSPGVMEKLGLDYETLHKVNDKLIYASISGFGQTGPYRCKSAYDIVVQAMAGMMSLTGFENAPPVKCGVSIADVNAGIHAAFSITSALYYRDRSGKGQHIDISMFDTLFAVLENQVVLNTFMGESPSRGGNRHSAAAPFSCYEVNDGHVAVAVANDVLFQKFATALDLPELIEDARFNGNVNRMKNQPVLDEIIGTQVSQWSSAELCERLEKVGVPVGPVKTIEELVQDPHIAAREMLLELDHPVVGKVQYPANPVKFSESKVNVYQRAPLLGEHSNEILATIKE